MKRSTELTMGSALILTFTAFVCWFFCLCRIRTDFSLMKLNAAAAAICLLSIYYVNYFLCGRGVSLRLYAIVQIVFAAAAAYFFSKLVQLRPWNTGTAAVCSVFYSFGVIVGAYISYLPAKPSSLSLCFDADILMMVTILLLGSYRELPASGTALAAALFSVLFNMLALVNMRLDREGAGGAVQGNPMAGKAILAGIFVVIVASAGLITLFALGGIGDFSALCLRAVEAAAEAIKSAARFLGELLYRFLLWLSQFIDSDPVQAGEIAAAEDGVGVNMVEYGDMHVPFYIYVILGLMAAAVIGVVIYRMKGERIGRRAGVRRHRRSVRREQGLKKSLAALFSRAVGSFKYYINCITYSSSAPALLAFCERKAPRGEKRMHCESGESFLLRLALSKDADDAAALKQLADLVEKSFYSGCKVKTDPELKKQIKAVKFASRSG